MAPWGHRFHVPIPQGRWEFGPVRFVGYYGPGHDLKLPLNEGVPSPEPCLPVGACNVAHMLTTACLCLVQVLSGCRERWVVFVAIGQHGLNRHRRRFSHFFAVETSLDIGLGQSQLLLRARVEGALSPAGTARMAHFRTGRVSPAHRMMCANRSDRQRALTGAMVA